MTDLDEARQFLCKLLPQAGEILKKYFYSGDFTSKSKGGVDFLTQADEEADVFLIKNIKEHYPKSEFLTEESAPNDYSSYVAKKNLWVIDPLDGTVNFSRGMPHFSISVGLVDQGRTKLGAILIPLENKIYWAQQDKEQAFCNERAIKVSKTDNMQEVVLGSDWAWDLQKRLKVVAWLKKICTEVRQIKSTGSAVADLAALAEGRIDCYLHSGLKPWDVAASALLIEKAGGKITTPDGKDWDIFNPEILASNSIIHEKVLELLNKWN